MDAGKVTGRPAAPGGRDVESFIGAKPGAAAKAKDTINSGAARSRADSMRASLEGRTQPFTAGWYAEHPNAWQYTHPYAQWWAVAGVVRLSTWLGYSVASGGGTTVATTSEATATDATASEQSAANDEASAAAPPSDLEWLPLGVYATAPKGADQAHVYQQLAVSKQGEIKGNYYDAITNAVQPVTGSIDQTTRKATWTVGASGGAMFATTLDGLVETPSSVTMTSGKSVQEWELVRMEQPEGKPPAP